MRENILVLKKCPKNKKKIHKWTLLGKDKTGAMIYCKRCNHMLFLDPKSTKYFIQAIKDGITTEQMHHHIIKGNE